MRTCGKEQACAQIRRQREQNSTKEGGRRRPSRTEEVGDTCLGRNLGENEPL